VPADLIVYAVVAAGLIFWLRSVLGTRGEDEPQRPNPYLAPSEKPSDRPQDDRYGLPETVVTPEARIIELARNPTNAFSVESKTAETGLIEIAGADKSFDVNRFLEGAQDAFVIIVECFAAGDRETLKDLLSPEVYKAFEGAITAREKNEEKQVTEIHALRKSEIIGARLQDKTAFITVRFTAEETSVTRDKNGDIIAGHPDKVTQMRDIWVFGRNVKSKDPRWLVYETRSDLEDDNDLVPNTD
jgi:predicted lipid-binding transport protein (Tim44 family)